MKSSYDAALLFFVIGVIGMLICFVFRMILQKYKWSDDLAEEQSGE